MNVLKYVTFFIAVLLLNACRSDEFSQTPDSNIISSDIPVSITGNLDGLIVDENQQPVVGALVEFGLLTTITDENGVFSFDEAVALSNGTLVKVMKDGYYDGFKFTSFDPGQNSIVKVQMITKEIIATFQNSEEATINVNGAQLYLPSNITTHANGSPYVGAVNVKAHWYDPADENSIAQMPGDLRGENVEGVAVQLLNFGMMAVEISSDSGEELKLKEGMNAILSLPIPANANAMDQIPMWHLDEDLGIWIEEGNAVKMGSSMVAEVSHFSYWDCGFPFEKVNMRGRLVAYPSNNPISGMPVIITDNDQMVSGYGYTDNDGIFKGAVPKGADLSMSIFHCGELIQFGSLGVLNEDKNLGDIIVDLENQLDLVADLVDCSGLPLEDGTALIATDYSLDLVAANGSQIYYTAFPCGEGVGNFQAYHQGITNVSDQLSFDLSESMVDFGEVTVCDGDLAEQITFSFQGGAPVTFTNATVSIVDDTYLHIYAEEVGSSPLNFIQLRYYLDGVPQDMGFQNSIYLGGELNGTSANDYTISDPNATWNNVTGLQVGDNVNGILDDHPIINVSVAYNLTIDQIVSTSSVTGQIWLDENEDGIRDAVEENIDEGIIIYSWTDSPGFRTYYNYFEVDSNGSYTVKGLAKDKEYYLVARSSTGEELELTSYQQGSDNTIDNDFKLDVGSSQQVTATFTLENEEILSHIGLGIK